MRSPARTGAGAWLLAIAVAEYLLASFLFDARGLLEIGGPLAGLGYLGSLGPLLASVLTAVAVVQARELGAAWAELRAELRPLPGGLFFAAHLAGLAALIALSRRLLGFSWEARGPSADPWVLGAWIATATASLLLLLVSVLPPAAIASAARRARAPLVLALLVGGLGFLAGRASESLWGPLARITLALVAGLLGPAVDDLSVDPGTMIIGSDRFWIEIAPVCSGYEGLGLIAVFTASLLWFGRRELVFPRALIVVPIALVAAFAANVLRLAALIWIGTFVSEPVALGGFHSKAGWVLFCGLALGISWWTRRSAWLSATRAAPLAGENPATPYLVPLLVVIAAGLVSGLFGAGFDRYYGLRVVAGVLALWLCRGPIRAAEVPRVGLAVGAGLAVAAIWAAANPTGGTEISAALAALGPAERTSWIVSRVIGSVLIAPIIEELAFRGYLLRRLSGADFRSVAYPQVTPAALAFSSLAFGAMHSRFWLGALAGLAYALVAKRTGSLAAAIVAHATTNAALTALSLATGDWSLL